MHHGLTLPVGATAGVKGGYFGLVHTYPSELAQTFWTAIVAWTTCFVVTIVVSLTGVLAFALGTWLLGFPLAVPLMTLAYLKVGAGESTLVSLLFAAGSGIVFYGLFVEAVRIPFEPGLLVDLLPI